MTRWVEGPSESHEYHYYPLSFIKTMGHQHDYANVVFTKRAEASVAGHDLALSQSPQLRQVLLSRSHLPFP
jgi:hypothetical protein